MKTILNIVVILLIAVIVASGVYALVEKTSLVSSSEAGMGQPPAMMNADGSTSTQPMGHPEGGDEHGASLTRGLSEVLVTLAKLTGITVIILLLQKGFDLVRILKLKTIQH